MGGTKKASELKVGDHVVERDGAFFAIKSIVHSASGKTLTFVLSNVNGYRSCSAELTTKCRATASVRVPSDATDAS